MVIIIALATTMAPFAGQNWGAQKYDRLNRALNLSFRFSWAWGIMLAIFFWLTAETIVGWFTSAPDAIRTAKQYLSIVPITFSLLGIIMMSSSVANGFGNPVPGMLMTIIRLLLVYLPLVWLLPHWFGLEGLFIATALANATVGIGAFIWIKRKCRRGTNARKVEQRRKAM